MAILAAVMPAPLAPVELREFPEPALAPGSVLLRTTYSEVCGTDVHIWHGRLAGVPYPIIPGHVSVGIAGQVRGDVRTVEGTRVAEGDTVAFFDVHRTCGRCRACTVTRTPTRCPARRVYGITDSAAEGLFGGWSQAIYLEPGVAIAQLPRSVPANTYISGGCGLITAVHAIERADITLGDTVLVQGTGAVGLSAIALAKIAGAARVVAFGAPADRLALAARMGADVVVDVQHDAPERRREIVHDATAGLGVDVAIEAAGSARAVEELKASADLEFLREDVVQLVRESMDGLTRVKNIVQKASHMQSLKNIAAACEMNAPRYSSCDFKLNLKYASIIRMKLNMTNSFV